MPLTVDEAVREHGSMVYGIASLLAKRLPPMVERQDLVQAGMLGLIDAVSRFDETLGTPFRAFASTRVHGAMLDELRAMDWMSRGDRIAQRLIADSREVVEQRLGRRALVADVAAELGVTAVRLEAMRMHADATIVSDEATEAVDRGPDLAAWLEHKQFIAALGAAFDTLPTREREVMTLYYDDDLMFHEIGARLNVSESRACQLHKQATRRLRDALADVGFQAVSNGVR